MGVVSIATTHRQAKTAVKDYPIWPGDMPLVGTSSEVADRLWEFTALGVDLFFIAFSDEPDLSGTDLFMTEVMPAVRAV